MALQLRFSGHWATAVPPFSDSKPPASFPSRNVCFRRIGVGACRARISSGESAGSGTDDNYLDMWKRAVVREKMEKRFQNVLENTEIGSHGSDVEGGEVQSPEDLERKTEEFRKILEVPAEERDRVQRLQVIDRAKAAIAAARAILSQNPNSSPTPENNGDRAHSRLGADSDDDSSSHIGGKVSGGSYSPQTISSQIGSPGSDFWTWAPPEDDLTLIDGNDQLQAQKPSVMANRVAEVMEKERTADVLSIPFQSNDSERKNPFSLPPMQSLMEREVMESPDTISESVAVNKDHEAQFSKRAEEAARALDEIEQEPAQGRNPDGARWWRTTGVETRLDGVVCRWTLIRGVTADGDVEWEDKYWEAADEFGYKELGSEKSGRDAVGSVWHEYWKESMWQEDGLMHLEKTADKWGKNGEDVEWQEKWWESYDASGKADKWAHKWCSIDPTTPLELGHAHVWHERWGEKYDGLGGSEKYTDKWAERCEGDGWSKWGDKWDEHFDPHSQGVKQGETWWQGKYGECWNRTWGEHHNNSGWVHKYGKSSCGEHWDNHVPEETWYEKYPHYGFMHCLQNTVQLRQVKRPSEME